MLSDFDSFFLLILLIPRHMPEGVMLVVCQRRGRWLHKKTLRTPKIAEKNSLTRPHAFKLK
jgi:hypothetical protein